MSDREMDWFRWMSDAQREAEAAWNNLQNQGEKA